MRVIGGDFGGRRLKAPRGLDTRPTSDRVREALFMALEPLAGIRVIDLFAGSGAQGIEALSRGAAWVDFVESRADARRVLSENLVALGIESMARVWPLRLPNDLKRIEASIEAAGLILLDPPYGGALARGTLEGLGRMRLRDEVRVVVEHHARDEMPERAGGLTRRRERRYGETVVSTYEHRTGAGEPGAAEGGEA